MNNSVNFFLNGKPISIEDPSPDLLLIDYLRSPKVGLAGPKKPCGQGGCGGCTVILSEWKKGDKKNKGKAEHLAINSCLRPVCALGGLSVTTVEGTGAARKPDSEYLLHRPSSSLSAPPVGDYGSPVLQKALDEAKDKRDQVSRAITSHHKNVNSGAKVEVVAEVSDHPSEQSHTGMNPVAHRLAMNNGSQCGYCSVGFVMNMSEFITNNPKATKKEIEDAFDGNLCRCTGYRSILTGMKTFASDWTEEDENERMKCIEDHVSHAQLPTNVDIPFPTRAKQPLSGVSTSRWLAPTTLNELAAIMANYEDIRLIHGNTSLGIYKEEYLDSTMHVDIRMIRELNTVNEIKNNHLQISASITYSKLIGLLNKAIIASDIGYEKTSEYGVTILGALDYMSRRTAGRIVRNAATVGGNTMLVLKHIPKHSGDPFPSDLFTALYSVNARIRYYEFISVDSFEERTKTAQELVEAVIEDPLLADRILLCSYDIPLGESNEVVLAQKVALRAVNSHSIVNTTTHFNINESGEIESTTLVFGGIAPYPWRATNTEKALNGRTLTLEDASEFSGILAQEVYKELVKWEERMEEVPEEGFTLEYRVQLAVSFLYKAIVNALIVKEIGVPENLESVGKIQWGNWKVTNGQQHYSYQGYKAPVSQPYIKVTAMYQTSGQTHYMHELPVSPLTLNSAFVQSKSALMNYHFVLPGKDREISLILLKEFLKQRFPEFTDLITYKNIKNGGVNLQGMGLDQPLFAIDLVSYVGQSIAMVLTPNEQDAIKIAKFVSTECVHYTKPGAPWVDEWSEPIIDLLDAIKKGSIFPDAPVSVPYVSHIWKVTRPGSQLDWTTDSDANPPEELRRDQPIEVSDDVIIDNITCTVVNSSQLCGGQVHFYMEPQGCIATPLDEGRMKVQPSVQSPAAMHDTVSMALGMQHHQIEINVPIVGGGFGGKTEQTRFIAGPTAVAAKATKRPVRLAVPRDEDTAMIGKRHAYYGEYQIAVDSGLDNEDNKGMIRGLQLKMWGDGGAFYDCSFIVSNCIQLRTDSAYKIPNFESQIDVCRTNKAPSTAMRAFGDLQGKNIVENAIEDAAISLEMRPIDLREKNLYDRGDVTPFGQALSYCYMKQVWNYTKRVSNFEKKYTDIQDFNKKNKWRKQGISLIPVKYGSGYNITLLEQAAAVVVVNPKDGTVIVHQGGIEMGQGLTTQAQQVAAYVLGIPMSMIYIGNANTAIIPNPTSTGGSVGTPYAAEATKQTCEQMRSRIMDFGYKLLKDNGEDWCKGKGIDFWNYGTGEGKGWTTIVEDSYGKKAMIWQNLTNIASTERVELIASFNSKIRGGEVQVPVMTFKEEKDQPNIPGIERIPDAKLGGGVDSFVGFTYSAACAVTEVDILTGEVKILSADLIYDMGWSMNPAIDIGQVEGAFIQGVGYLLTEKLVSETKGSNVGRLNTTNTWRYKIPAVTTIPLEMNTYLFPLYDESATEVPANDKPVKEVPPNESVQGIPQDKNLIFSAKEVGEPPLVLANSVFFAVKSAIRASRVERKLDPLFRLDAPATVQEIRRACEVSESDLGE
jgi:xanthine dehydrogenase/oxidase